MVPSAFGLPLMLVAKEWKNSRGLLTMQKRRRCEKYTTGSWKKAVFACTLSSSDNKRHSCSTTLVAGSGADTLPSAGQDAMVHWVSGFWNWKT